MIVSSLCFRGKGVIATWNGVGSSNVMFHFLMWMMCTCCSLLWFCKLFTHLLCSSVYVIHDTINKKTKWGSWIRWSLRVLFAQMASSSEDVTEDLLDTDVMVLQNWGVVMSCPWCAHPSGDEVSPAGRSVVSGDPRLAISQKASRGRSLHWLSARLIRHTGSWQPHPPPRGVGEGQVLTNKAQESHG